MVLKGVFNSFNGLDLYNFIVSPDAEDLGERVSRLRVWLLRSLTMD